MTSKMSLSLFSLVTQFSFCTLWYESCYLLKRLQIPRKLQVVIVLQQGIIVWLKAERSGYFLMMKCYGLAIEPLLRTGLIVQVQLPVRESSESLNLFGEQHAFLTSVSVRNRL